MYAIRSVPVCRQYELIHDAGLECRQGRLSGAVTRSHHRCSGQGGDTLSCRAIEELLDYRRSVSDLYAYLRRPDIGAEHKSAYYRRGHDRLFGTHSQSALSAEGRAGFSHLNYYDYDPAFRSVVPLDKAVESETVETQLEDDGLVRLKRFARIHFEVQGQGLSLALFWILGYGGGVFLPFQDSTNGDTTYGGGRYLLDSIKHADLRQEDGKLVIDFNFAYNPSCAYDSRWHGPLAPAEKRLPVPITAGEQVYVTWAGMPSAGRASKQLESKRPRRAASTVPTHSPLEVSV